MTRSWICILVVLTLAIPTPSAGGEDIPVEALISQARALAMQDRNAESMRLFQEAISREPGKRQEWLLELADQTNYAGHPEEAVRLYREYLTPTTLDPAVEKRARKGLALALAWSGEHEESRVEFQRLIQKDPDDIEARLGYARVLSWSDRNDAAEEAYAQILRLSPEQAVALHGHAQVQSWRGRQRLALRELGALLEKDSQDTEALVMMAQGQNWMGRTDRALDTLDHLFRVAPDHPEGRHLEREFREQIAPEVLAGYQYSDQSDGLQIQTLTLSHDRYLGSGRTVLGPRFQQIVYTPHQAGQEAIQVGRPGLYARHRGSDDWEWTMDAFVDFITGPAGRPKHVTVTYNTYVTNWPSDFVRLDAGLNRVTFDNIVSLTRDITATTLSFSIDLTPDELMRYSVRARYGIFNDDNSKREWQGEVEKRVFHHPKVYVGVRYTGFDFGRRLDNGYFNPNTYHAIVAAAHTYGSLSERWQYDLEGTAGQEMIDPDGHKPEASISGRLGYAVSKRIDVEGHYGYFNSSLTSSSGFYRGTAALRLRIRW